MMMNSNLLQSGFGIVLFLLLSLADIDFCLSKSPSGHDRRNIVFILVDDQRYDFLSFLDHPWIQTPNIDRLASRSMYFSNAFVTTSLCSPSRASIMTGQYAHAHQVIDNNTSLPAAVPTFPRQLQNAGYTTAFIGKWHMGGENDNPRPGFDEWISFRGQGSYRDPTFNINGRRVSRKGYTPDLLTDYACDFIKSQKTGSKPYFLYVSHKSIHGPFTPADRHQYAYHDLEIPRPPSFADTEENYAGKPRWVIRQRKSHHGVERSALKNSEGFDSLFRRYSACMLAVDDGVGRIANTLDSLGQLDETVIIYFSDNGYLMGEHGLIDKRVMYEESIRVPAFVHCPDMIAVPAFNEELILNIDIGPTILDMGGADIPASMHGRSFYPLLLGSAIDWRKAFIYEYFVDPYAVQTPTIFGLRTEKYSYMTYHGIWDIWELYDLAKDPKQTKNLLGEISYGKEYGTFLNAVRVQDSAVYEIIVPMEQQLDALLRETNGSRIPTWTR